MDAAAFGRLCVETAWHILVHKKGRAAAFGRLCVETTPTPVLLTGDTSSRLRAAVC